MESNRTSIVCEPLCVRHCVRLCLESEPNLFLPWVALFSDVGGSVF